MEINILQMEILKYLKEKDCDVKDYVLYGKDPDGIHEVQSVHDFPLRLTKKGINPNPVEIVEALENLEIDGYVHIEPVDFVVNNINVKWKKCKITIEGKKYLRMIEQLTK
ncbi:MAG: hypothetical protein FP824_06545 [Euryarchaeota archaeon]|nr:hypothetical protein [Euryarchaeota archaeon]